MNQIGDYVVCPGHGVGLILNIESKMVGDLQRDFYLIRIVSNSMMVMIPTDLEDGIRNLIDHSDVDSVFTLLSDHQVKIDTSTWNRRYRDYVNKVKTGSLLEIADVLRSLLLLKSMKKLSFGERRMLEQCKELIVKEVSISVGKNEVEVEAQIESCFNSSTAI